MNRQRVWKLKSLGPWKTSTSFQNTVSLKLVARVLKIDQERENIKLH